MGGDPTEWIALGIVVLAAGVFVWSKLKKRKQGCDACSGSKEPS